MSVEFYLQTRGKTIDYRFLYEAPSSDSEWWRYYADYTLFEDETIILERLAGKECRLYLSGIPSNRTDRVNRIIRYTLVAELGQGEHSEKTFQLVKQFLDDCRNKSNTLGESLDSCFQERDIEDALRSTGSSEKERQDQISQKIADLVNLDSKSSSLDQCLEGIRWGWLLSDKSYKAWLSLASRILTDVEPGVAALLNATSERSLPSLKEKLLEKQIKNAFILLPDSDETPQLVKDAEIRNENLSKKLLSDGSKWVKSWSSSFQNKIYIGIGVFFSALAFIVFVLVR